MLQRHEIAGPQTRGILLLMVQQASWAPTCVSSCPLATHTILNVRRCDKGRLGCRAHRQILLRLRNIKFGWLAILWLKETRVLLELEGYIPSSFMVARCKYSSEKCLGKELSGFAFVVHPAVSAGLGAWSLGLMTDFLSQHWVLGTTPNTLIRIFLNFIFFTGRSLYNLYSM